MDLELQKRHAGERAAAYLRDGMAVGLGTGSTVRYFIEAAGRLARGGMRLVGVPTSRRTEELAKSCGIPLTDIDRAGALDLAVDGVDELDPCFNAVKGGGGALFREKVVAASAREVVWILDSTKRVAALGVFPLPVEVLPFGHTQVLRRLQREGLSPVLRMRGEGPFVTDNGNYIVDLHLQSIPNPRELLRHLTQITGIVENGLFLNFCRRAVVGTEEGALILENPAATQRGELK